MEEKKLLHILVSLILLSSIYSFEFALAKEKVREVTFKELVNRVDKNKEPFNDLSWLNASTLSKNFNEATIGKILGKVESDLETLVKILSFDLSLTNQKFSEALTKKIMNEIKNNKEPFKESTGFDSFFTNENAINPIVEKILNEVKSNKNFFKIIAEQTTKNLNDELANKNYQKLVEDVLEKQSKRKGTYNDNKNDKSFVSEALSAFGEINKKATSPSSSKEGMYIFVSFSMPKELLWTLNEEAKSLGARLVIRGLKDNSFKETFKAVQLDKKRVLRLDINPKLFEKYSITQVPTFVITEGSDSKYDKITGNLSTKYVLEEFSQNGELKNSRLLSKLIRMANL